MKKVVVSVTNDLVSDQRVQRTISVLREQGFEPAFIGRKLPHSPAIELPYSTRRFALWFRKGFLFYATYNLRLFWYLLFNRFDLYLSNDLDTLLPNFLVSKLYNKPLIYDSHEYFTGVPEIQQRPFVKWVWTRLEGFLFPRLSEVVTVNESIAELYRQQYGKQVEVVRNISDARLPAERVSRQELGLPPHAFLLLNQGAGINIDRGMEECLEALPLLPPEVMLMIVGSGDALPGLKQMASQLNLEHRVFFIPRQPYLKMLQYTLQADAGLSLDKPTSPNYQYSLPNKIFDYIKCGLPVVVSSVVEVKKVVEAYEIGAICSDHQPKNIAQAILSVKSKGKTVFKKGLAKAATENNWQRERQVWEKIFRRYR
ncbi:MAG: glycosyltransferase [Owenweeksia sp.]|nr:glycosyltransferase [Owenweeksia sp.]